MELLDRVQDNWIVLLIPFISAFVGWITNVLAVRMMFYPTNFVGIPPWFGWQGLIPLNAPRLAQRTTKLITDKLLSLEQMFEQFKSDDLRAVLDPVADQITEQILQEIAEKHAPEMWANANDVVKDQVRGLIRVEVMQTCLKISEELGQNINDVMDLEKTVIDAVVANRRLMSLMFLRVGSEEFKFIERSGIWFGFLFGLIQMVIWVLYPAWWILPLAGFFVGYATNWLAIKLIFEPQEPRKYGPVVVQGLFHKRQDAVADEFAKLAATRILNADNITIATVKGPTGERVFEIVEKHINGLVDKYEQHPMAAMMMPADKRPQIRQEVVARIREELPKPGGFLHTFAGNAVDMQTELRERMAALDPASFEGVLRPAFQQDEWKLIIAGAALGLAAGILQLVYLFDEVIKNLAL